MASRPGKRLENAGKVGISRTAGQPRVISAYYHRRPREFRVPTVAIVGLYLVERYVPSLGPEQIAVAVGRLATLDAPDVSHLWTVLIPSEDTCLSLFAAPSPQAVEEVNRRAGFAFTRTIVAVAFSAAGRDAP